MSDNKTCLVVDDSDVIREIAVRIVADLGLDVEGVSNAAEAIENCQTKKPAAVFLDWDLPSMGALDFLRGAAALDEADKPTIILCATENDHQKLLFCLFVPVYPRLKKCLRFPYKSYPTN